jgi:hypothetical protein
METLGVKYDHAHKGTIRDVLSVYKCSNLYLKSSNIDDIKKLAENSLDITQDYNIDVNDEELFHICIDKYFVSSYFYRIELTQERLYYVFEHINKLNIIKQIINKMFRKCL